MRPARILLGMAIVLGPVLVMLWWAMFGHPTFPATTQMDKFAPRGNQRAW